MVQLNLREETKMTHIHKYHYGYAKSLEDIIDQARIVCHGLDSDKVYNNSLPLVLETSAQETDLGFTKDPTEFAGMGICQFDRGTFYDTQKRSAPEWRQPVLDSFGIDINLVNWENLRYNIFLSFLFCRLKYKLVPEVIPETVDGRWNIYKTWYNSYKGDAKKDQYLESAEYVKELL